MLDMIDDNFVNMLSHEKVAKWQRTTNLGSMEKSLKETQLRDLPYVLRMPKEIYGKEDLSEYGGYLYVAVSKQEIAIVNKKTGQEYPIVT